MNLSLHVPESSEADYELRLKLEKARELATARIGQWEQHSEDAHQLAWVVVNTASRMIYARAGTAALKHAVDTCCALLRAADAVDLLNGDIGPLTGLTDHAA